MTPERWQEIKQLFEAALACTPDQRRSFLAEACRGDAGLHQEVESLLTAHERPGQLSDVLGMRILATGSRLGPYEILAVLGAGGMGEVYKARDTRLDRIVAIKVVSPLVAGDPELRLRFEREARAVARLNHPHICTLHDVGVDQGVSFLVMEHLEGETLAEHLSRSALTLDQLLRYAMQIADALDAAHRQGITHRDLKPANIMLTERGATLLDFGLAKLRGQHESGTRDGELTTLGQTPGTLHYMAPEQLAGKETDARTDIFAFGAVLYEMATRKKAFDGTRPLTPSSLDAVVTSCLAKDPTNRWQSCGDLLAALRRIADGLSEKERAPRSFSRTRRLALAAVVPLLLVAGIAYVQWPRGTVPDSVAVLPFFNTTGDVGLDYLSDGITDGLINSLSQIPSLRVTPRALVARYANERADMETIARTLDVRAVVTGRITQSDDTVTVAIELVDVEELSQLWGAQYRSSLVGVMDVERTIAVELAGRLHHGQSRSEPSELTRQYAQVPEAYQAYLKGRYYLKLRTAEGYSRAIEHFEQAAATDPSYALAYAGLAEAFATLGYFSVLPSNVAFPKAKTAALRALQLDDGLAEAHSSLAAVLLLYEWNFPSAEQRYKVSLGLNHMVPEPVMGYSMYLASQGRLREAIAESVRAEQLDPVAPRTVLHTGWIYYFDRQYDRAIEQVQKTLELNPTFPRVYELLTEALLAKGQGANELRAIAKRYAADTAAISDAVAYLDAVHGDDLAQTAFLKTLRRPAEEPQIPWFLLASTYVALGRHSEALDFLEKAYAMRESPIVWLNVIPKFDPLRSDPRFVDLVRRMGLAH